MFEEFKKFALRGNVIDLAVGIIIGSAFTTVVNSLVNDIIMPPIGLLAGDLDFTNYTVILRQGDPAGPYATLAAAQEAGAVTINYGQFLTSIISFLIVTLAVFLLVRAINRLYIERQDEEATAEPVDKECPYCFKTIPVKATRCAFCTSDLEGQPTAIGD